MEKVEPENITEIQRWLISVRTQETRWCLPFVFPKKEVKRNLYIFRVFVELDFVL